MDKDAYKIRLFFSTMIVTLLLLPGCGAGSNSAGNALAVNPDMQSIDQAVERAGSGNEHQLWGCYNFSFDPESLSIKPVPSRGADVHFNVTGLLQPPACDDCLTIDVLEFTPANHYVKLKITIKNHTQLTGYDVRGIMVTDISGIRLLNPDSHTDLWDDGGDITINPFRAFATDQPQHRFLPGAAHARIYEIAYSTLQDLAKTVLAVDASWPGNCREPYSIGDFIQPAPLPGIGGAALVKLSVYDWQSNAEGIYIDASPVGGGAVELTYQDGYTWSGTIETSQVNQTGKYDLLVSAGTSDSQIKLFNYFPLTVVFCLSEGNETWEASSDLPLGSDSGIQVVCPDDTADWYSFQAGAKLTGGIKLEIIDNNGECDITFYKDPQGGQLLYAKASYGQDALLTLDPLKLDFGDYFIRVRFLGDGEVERRYVLYNNATTIQCTPEGNETWENAAELPIGEDSGIQVVCLDDKADWYKFSSTGSLSGNITFELLNDTGTSDLALYDNPESDYLFWKSVSFGSKVIIDAETLGLGSGTYYLRVRHIGSDPWVREYILYNNTEIWPCQPEGNETWQQAFELSCGYDSGPQMVCIKDKDDWYFTGIADHILGSIKLHLVNDTGQCNLNFYSNPDGPPLIWATATYGSDAVLDITPLDLGPGTYYTLVKHIGTDEDTRDYVLENNTKDSPCYPDGNDSPDVAIELQGGQTSGSQYVCLDDKEDWYWFSTVSDLWGFLDLHVLNGTGPADITLYDEGQSMDPDGPHAAWKQADPDCSIDLSSLGLPAGTYYIRIRHIGSDSLYREYVLENSNQPEGYARTWGNSESYDDWPNVAADGAGDVYVAGNFYGTIDFDPGPGVDERTALYVDPFICKYDPDGNYQWVRSWGGENEDYSSGVAVDNNGNVYICGAFYDDTGTPIDFDPGPGQDMHTSYGKSDAFLSEYDSQGNYIRTGTWGGVGYDDVFSVDVDDFGNIYLAGFFQQTADFDPGPGLQLRDAATELDIYLLKLDPSGNFCWVVTWGGVNPGYTRHNISVSDNGDIYFSGDFSGTWDFDPGPEVEEHSALGDRDAFILKCNSNGEFQWARTWGADDGTSTCVAPSIISHGSNEIYVCGQFQGLVDFDPGAGGDLHASLGLYDAYLTKFDSYGEFQRALTWGGQDNDFAELVTVDNQDNAIVAGGFMGTPDLDPGQGTFIIISHGYEDAFVLKLNPSGDFVFAQTFGGVYDDLVTGISVDSKKRIYLCGSFMQTVDFYPGPGLDFHTALGGSDIFLCRYKSDGSW